MNIERRTVEAVKENKEKFDLINKINIEFYEEMKRLGLVKENEYNIVPIGSGNDPSKEVTFLVR